MQEILNGPDGFWVVLAISSYFIGGAFGTFRQGRRKGGGILENLAVAAFGGILFAGIFGVIIIGLLKNGSEIAGIIAGFLMFFSLIWLVYGLAGD